MFYGITDLGTFILGTIIIVLLPGPNSLYVMAAASKAGLGAGFRGAAGIFVGDSILMLLTAAGAASLIRTTPALFGALQYAGAAYLAYLGLGLLRSAWRGWRRSPSGVPLPALSERLTPFRSALTISLLNPKAILFFVSFFVQFVSPDYPHPALTFLLLAIIVQVFSLAYLSALILGGALLAGALREKPRVSALASGTVGGLFVGFGVKLALAGLA